MDCVRRVHPMDQANLGMSGEQLGGCTKFSASQGKKIILKEQGSGCAHTPGRLLSLPNHN